MKKSVIALILAAVLIIIISPAIVGKFAEESVGENLNWAAHESGELVVTSDGFDRGWFSSEGQHRIELGDGQVRAALAASGDTSELPVLLINTHIDHGIIAVSSMAREQGSLAPGLGRAVSTLAIQLGDEIIDLPGKIYSEVGMGGDLDSRYIVEAGSQMVDGGEVTWQPTTINIASSAKTGDITFDGEIGAMTFGDTMQVVAIDGLKFKGEQTKTSYGFNVGDLDMTMGAMTITYSDMPSGGMQGLSVKAKTAVDGDQVNGSMRMEIDGQSFPGFGDISVIADMTFDEINAEALGTLAKRLDSMNGNQDPTMALMEAQDEFRGLVAGGMNLDVKQFDIGLPMGTVEAKMNLALPASDPGSFEWTSLLLDAVASIDLKIPEALVQFATSMDPQAAAVVGMGYLKKDGDFYIMDADFQKGLLTVNGAPIPIPMGAF